jgi:hypothetical protein
MTGPYTEWDFLEPARLGIAPSILAGILSSMATTRTAPIPEARYGPDKVRENRLRRAAERQGLALMKSRRRDPRALGYGRYMIVDPATNTVLAGELDSPRALDLDAVEAWLSR